MIGCCAARRSTCTDVVTTYEAVEDEENGNGMDIRTFDDVDVSPATVTKATAGAQPNCGLWRWRWPLSCCALTERTRCSPEDAEVVLAVLTAVGGAPYSNCPVVGTAVLLVVSRLVGASAGLCKVSVQRPLPSTSERSLLLVTGISDDDEWHILGKGGKIPAFRSPLFFLFSSSSCCRCIFMAVVAAAALLEAKDIVYGEGSAGSRS